MKLTEQQTLHIAQLATIHLDAEDIDKLTHDLSDILSMAQTLQEVDCDAIEPLAHPLENLVPLYRADQVEENNQRELLQKGAPATMSGLYLVPQVIE